MFDGYCFSDFSVNFEQFSTLRKCFGSRGGLQEQEQGTSPSENVDVHVRSRELEMFTSSLQDADHFTILLYITKKVKS